MCFFFLFILSVVLCVTMKADETDGAVSSATYKLFIAGRNINNKIKLVNKLDHNKGPQMRTFSRC